MPRLLDHSRDARRWLAYARANLLHAEVGHAGGVMIEYLCFDAQQAAEKALKAVLIAGNIDVPRTHDIQGLLTLLMDAGVEVPNQLKGCGGVDGIRRSSAVPGLGESLDDDALAEALALARAVVDWAEGAIESSPPPE